MNKLDRLWQRGKDFLECEYPIIGGAMSWISESNLVSSVSNAGGFGVLASSSMNGELFEKEIIATKSKTKKNFGINIILMNPYLDEIIDVSLKHDIKYIILAGGLPKKETIKRIKDGGSKVIAFAPNLPVAKMFVNSGVDAIILEGSEAGGHIGPVSTSVLIQEVLPFIKEVPIFVAGGIGRGEMVSKYLEMGAAGVQIGTMLVCSTECIAHDNFKNAFIKAQARHAQPTVQMDPELPVIPVRALVNKGTKDFNKLQIDVITEYKNNLISKEDAILKIEKYWAGALRRAVIDGDTEYGSLMAGQSVGLVSKVDSVSNIINNLINEANNSLKE